MDPGTIDLDDLDDKQQVPASRVFVLFCFSLWVI